MDPNIGECNSVLFSLIWPYSVFFFIKSNLILFGPLRPYSVHIGFIRFTLVLFCPFVFIQSTLVLFCPFGFIKSHSLQFGLIRSYSVHFGHLILFGLSWPASVQFGPHIYIYIYIYIHTHIYSHTNKQLYGHFICLSKKEKMVILSLTTEGK